MLLAAMLSICIVTTRPIPSSKSYKKIMDAALSLERAREKAERYLRWLKEYGKSATVI